jgi:GT2 family glycosyltransferase
MDRLVDDNFCGMSGSPEPLTTSTSARVTAIVLNWCNEDETAACLESLAACNYPALTVVLVDNGSPDGSGDRLRTRFPHVEYLQTGTNLGYAGGNNRGFDAARAIGADYVLVLNNDTVLDALCIDLLVRAAEETGAAVVAPQIMYFDEPSIVWYGGGAFSVRRALGVHDREDMPVERSDSRRPISFVCGCCFLIRDAVLQEMGGFDESFFAYAEDAELSLRLTSAGYRLLYEPRATLLHRIERGAEPSPFQIRQRDKNRRRIASLHFRPADRIRFALWFYPTRLIHLIRYFVFGKPAHARAIIDGAFSSLHA